MIEIVWTAFAFLAVFVLPGLFCTYLLQCFIPFVISTPGRVLLGHLASFWLALAGGLFLSKLGLLFPHNALYVVLGLNGILLLAVVLTRKIRLQLEPDREYARKIPLPLLIISLVLVLAFHGFEIAQSAGIRGGAFYLSEVKHIVARGGFPQTVEHFGEDVQPQIDKIGFDIITSLYWSVSPDNPVLVKKVGYFGIVALGCIAAFHFFLLFSSPLLAMVGTLLLYANLQFGYMVALRAFFIPESCAFVMVLICFAYYLKEPFIRRRSREGGIISAKSRHLLPIIAALALAAAGLHHLEIGALGACFIAFFSILNAAWFPTKRAIARLITTGFSSFFFFMSAYLLIGRRPPFIRSALGIEPYEAFEGMDPTWEFVALGKSQLPFREFPPLFSDIAVLREILWSQGLLFRSGIASGVIGFLFVAMVLFLGMQLVTVRRHSYISQRLIFLALASLTTIVFVVGLALWSNGHFSIWVYSTEVTRRVAPYLYVFLLIFAFAVLKVFVDRTLTHDEPTQSERSIKVGGGLLVIALILYGMSFPLREPLKTPFPLTRDGILALEWLKTTDNHDKRILANAVSSGEFHVHSGHLGLLEGHQPLLRPELLKRSLLLIRGAQSFFRDPQAHYDFLTEHSIAYVVVQRGDSPQFGGPLILPANELNIPEDRPAPFLLSRAKFGRVDIYEVQQ